MKIKSKIIILSLIASNSLKKILNRIEIFLANKLQLKFLFKVVSKSSLNWIGHSISSVLFGKKV